MTSSPRIELTLGDFDLFGDGDTWRCETLADGTDLSGNPVPVEVAIRTLIQDGSVSFTEKYDNATITVMVCLSGPDSEALDAGAAALFAELGKPNVLTYRGPQAFESVAWDVVNSRLERTPDDLGEVRGDRFYSVTLTVLPFRRAVEKTVSVSPGTVVGTGRQRTGAVAVGGSARTPGTLTISTAGPSLGDTLVYVWRDPDDATNYMPALTNAYEGGGGSVVVTPGNVSGKEATLTVAASPRTFLIPRANLPAGDYLIVARVKSSSGTTVGRVDMEARTYNTFPQTFSSPTLTLSTTYENRVLGSCTLPTADVPTNSTGNISLLLSQTIDSGASINLDEMWLFHKTLGALIWVNATDKYLWVLPPDTASPRPRLFIGSLPDMSDARFPVGGVRSWQLPQFIGPAANHLTVAPTFADAVTSFSHYERKAG